MILVAVGTFLKGFDELVAAADAAAGELGVAGFAQIGHSAVVPRHLAWARFLPPDELGTHLAAARVVVCHGGVGLIGEAMRAGRPILVVPRRGRPTRASPAGDQVALARRLAELHGLRVAEEPGAIRPILAEMLAEDGGRQRYALGSDAPQILARFLAGGLPQSRPTRSS